MTGSILDARAGSVPHPCAGVWHYAGLNAGGHEVFTCDGADHVLIGPHVNAGHECGPQCVGTGVCPEG